MKFLILKSKIEKYTSEEIENIKKKYTLADENLSKRKASKVHGFLFVVTILMFIESVIYLLCGSIALRNFGILPAILFWLISVLCIANFVLIIQKKKIAKKTFIGLMGFCILASSATIIMSLINNSLRTVAMNLFIILKDTLFIRYFIKSDYVNEYLNK
ncbi:hypothetical protein [Treponema zioleckii]|uniref:hypothetical protein n=1 Tax=Treponema zioleckii TaxID=331680 RepID=UPI00168B3F27|nr:hypothetical protein [Treponema zioleckii]